MNHGDGFVRRDMDSPKMTSNATIEEREPLLQPSPSQSSENGISNPKIRWRWAKNLKDIVFDNPILICTFVLQFLTYFAKHMVEVPMIRLFERAICNRYYASIDTDTPNFALIHVANVDESRCKIPPIQNELAGLVGLKFTFDALPGLITALFYGAIADRFGRRLVLALCCTGTLCSLLWILFVCYAEDLNIPVKLIWASSFFLLLGGSQRVAKGMNFTIVADTTDVTHRTRFMYLLAGIPHLTTLIAPPVSGVLMRVRIWVPFAVAIGSLALSLLLLFFMPESLNHASTTQYQDHDPLLGPGDIFDNDSDEEEDGALPESAPSAEQLPRGIYDRLPAPAPSKKEWWRDIVTLLQKPGLPFCYVLFFLKPVAMISKAYVYQYASYNFDWGLSQTTWLRFAQAGGSSIATIMVLPLLSSVLNRKGLRAQHLDINVIRISLLIATIGFLVLQFSFHGWMLLLALFICGLSEGEEPALQGLATSLIDRAYHARLFTSVAVVEIVAKLGGGPMMGKLFSIGRSGEVKGSAGICFSVSAGILFCLMIIAVFQKLKR